jgi:DNA-binding NtrC family response regulator
MPRDRVLVVEDETQFLDAVSAYLTGKEFDVISCKTWAEAAALWRTCRPDVVLLDHNLPDGNALDLIMRLRPFDPDIPIIILTAEASIDLAVQAVKLGAEQFLTKPIELSTLHVVIQRCIENRRNRLKQLAEKTRQSRDRVDPFLGRSPVIRRLAEICAKVVTSDSPILIQGETGTGKGVLAHWFHENSSRNPEPFVDLNCGGLSRELLESELFGYEKGAFTGAVQSKAGLLEIAHKGTVFLDEIGDVDLQLQPRLLKVLEEKQFRRLGDIRDRRVDVRLVAATHQDIVRLIRDKQFRSDLYFRINTIPLTTPALRERVEDIPVLAEYFLKRLPRDMRTGGEAELSEGALRALQSYPWPGNIRELRNVLERAVLLSDNKVLRERDLHFDLPAEPVSVQGASSNTQTLDEMEKEYIERILSIENGRVEATAKRLGIPRSSLYNKLKQYGIVRHPGPATLQ